MSVTLGPALRRRLERLELLLVGRDELEQHARSRAAELGTDEDEAVAIAEGIWREVQRGLRRYG